MRSRRIRGDPEKNAKAAISYIQRAIDLFENRYPETIAFGQMLVNLGNAILTLGRIGSDRDLKPATKDAISRYEKAHEILSKAGSPSMLEQLEANLATTRAIVAPHDLQSNIEPLQKASDALRDTDPEKWARIQFSMANMYSRASDARAISVYESALSVYTEASFPRERAEVLHNLALAYFEHATTGADEHWAAALGHSRAALNFFWAYRARVRSSADSAIDKAHVARDVSKATAVYVACHVHAETLSKAVEAIERFSGHHACRSRGSCRLGAVLLGMVTPPSMRGTLHDVRCPLPNESSRVPNSGTHLMIPNCRRAVMNARA